jgi:hypothetical protein
MTGDSRSTFELQSTSGAVIASGLAHGDTDFIEHHKAGLAHADLRGMYLSRGNFEGASMPHADLRGANFSNCSFARANMSRANLTGARFSDCNFEEADLNHADCAAARFSDCRIYRTRLYQANFRGATITRAGETVTISKYDHTMCIAPCGRWRQPIFGLNTDHGLFLHYGCFWGSVQEFRDFLTHRRNVHGDHWTQYDAAIGYFNLLVRQEPYPGKFEVRDRGTIDPELQSTLTP